MTPSGCGSLRKLSCRYVTWYPLYVHTVPQHFKIVRQHMGERLISDYEHAVRRQAFEESQQVPDPPMIWLTMEPRSHSRTLAAPTFVESFRPVNVSETTRCGQRPDGTPHERFPVSTPTIAAARRPQRKFRRWVS